MEKELKTKLVEYILTVGKEISHKAGHIKDIGVRKQWLTEEDVRIERGLHSIISEFDNDHKFYAEEENDQYFDAKSVWVADPISGTKLFIESKPHYAIVVSHLSRGNVDYVIVYDPSADDLYVAEEGRGIYLNDKQISRDKDSSKKKKIIFAPSYTWDLEIKDTLQSKLAVNYEIFPSQGSFAVNYCLAGIGLFNGVVSLTKDSFPEFAGCYYANQSGLIATNIKGQKDINSDDRVFVCGENAIYNDLLEITKSIIL